MSTILRAVRVLQGLLQVHGSSAATVHDQRLFVQSWALPTALLTACPDEGDGTR